MQLRRTFHFRLLIVIVCLLFVPAALRASIAPSAGTVFFNERQPLQPPPGSQRTHEPMTFMLELMPDAKQQRTSESQLADQIESLGVPVLFEARSAYRGIAVTATPQQIARIRQLPGVGQVRLIPPKERSLVSVVQQVGVEQLWNAASLSARGSDVTGRGVRIGIIDSGIDYTHATFGGPGTAAAYAANNPTLVESGSFPTAKVIGGFDFVGDAYNASGSGSQLIPVPDDDPLDCIGSGGALGSVEGGHGTHVAAIAAGYGVTSSGGNYSGSYTALPPPGGFSIGPGIAPMASLYAFKIFGCQGTTTFLTAAIDYAIDPNGDGDTSDRLVDVLNISLGSPFGSPDDPDAVAVNRAVEAGVVVVVAAGDGGDVFYSAESPASATQAIAVGGSAGTSGLAGFSSRGPQRGGGVKPDLVAPAVNISSAASGSGNGALVLSGSSVAAPQVAGAAALMREIYPGWAPQQIKAAIMNASVELTNSSGAIYPPSLVGAGRLNIAGLEASDLVAYAADNPAGVALGFGVPWIGETVQISRMLRIDNRGTAARTVQLTPRIAAQEAGVNLLLNPGPYTLPADSTLQVPVTLQINPQLLDFSPDATTALTTNAFARFYLAEHGGAITINSTLGARLRVAHAAGITALDIYRNGELFEAGIDDGTARSLRVVPPGTHTIAVRERGASSTSTPLATMTVTLVDGQDYTLVVHCEGIDYRLSLVEALPPESLPRDQVALRIFNGAALDPVGPSDVYVDGLLAFAAVPPSTATEFLALTPGDHQVQFFVAGATPATSSPYATFFFRAGAGDLVLVVDGRVAPWEHHAFAATGRRQNATEQRVPFTIFPRAAANTSAATPVVTVPLATTLLNLPLQNSGARAAASSTNGGQTPLVSAFELPAGGESPIISGLRDSLRSADLRYVGVTNNIAASLTVERSLIFFGTVAAGAWETPNEVQHRIYIDSTGPAGVPDGIADYLLINISRGAVTPPSDPTLSLRADDVLSSVLYPLDASGNPQIALRRATLNVINPPQTGSALDTAPFGSTVMVQVLEARTIGLNISQPRFRYYVETYARDLDLFNTPIDRLPAADAVNPWLEYDLTATAVAPSNDSTVDLYLRTFPFFVANSGAQVSMAVTPSVLAARGTQRVLLLSHHNTPNTQASIVTLQSSAAEKPATPPSERAGGYAVMLPLVAR
ncbi:MAG TPA: S8 family serine peptidase [Roseiflexaceae bacterium]|nr:S8 family serine peptidase [Roseiflexaceae bacterium]